MAEIITAVALVVVGFVALLGGGEMLVRGSAGLAAALRISPLIIGLTVVAFGTSSPELAVVLQGAFLGKQDVAVGNIVGSCIFNVLFILGLTAIVRPLVISASLVRLEVPLMIISSVAVLLFGWDGLVGRTEAAVLFAALLAYMAWTVHQARRERHEFQEGITEQVPIPARHGLLNLLLEIVLVVAGLVALLFGSRWVVQGAVALARMFGVGELVIGLTIVAIGTSLPEVVTSVVAGLRGRSDIAVGNIVGSNIFNILCVLGLSGLVAPAGIAVSGEALHLDIPVMIGVAVVCLPIFWTSYRVDRIEGAILFGGYVAYTTYIILAATGSFATRTFGSLMLFLVLPLAVLVIAVRAIRALIRGNHAVASK